MSGKQNEETAIPVYEVEELSAEDMTLLMESFAQKRGNEANGEQKNTSVKAADSKQ